MPINLADMRLGVTRPIGINVGGTQMSTAQIDLYLNRAYWEIQNKFPFREKEAISTFDTVAGVRNYDVEFPVEAIKHIAIQEREDMGTNRQHYPLIQITRDQYEQRYREDEGQWSIPKKYVREDNIIKFFPTPNNIYQITIKRLIALNDLGSSSATDTSDVPQVWDEIIVLGGLWRACVDIGDLARSGWFKSMQAELINTIVPTEVKEDQSNSQLAHVEVPGLEYCNE